MARIAQALLEHKPPEINSLIDISRVPYYSMVLLVSIVPFLDSILLRATGTSRICLVLRRICLQLHNSTARP